MVDLPELCGCLPEGISRSHRKPSKIPEIEEVHLPTAIQSPNVMVEQ
jgi:hypothetical protein